MRRRVKMAHNPTKEYLGDAVYVTYDGFHIVLTTENGISVTNEICIDRDVWESLIVYNTNREIF